MPTRNSNNVWRPPQGLNYGSFAQIGGQEPVGTRMQGQLGGVVQHSNATALLDSYTTTGTMYEGEYQLVKLTSAVSRGELVFWDTLANNGINDFEVTHTVTAPAMFRAGVAICDGTSGEYAFIQISGLASCLNRASVTSKVLGNLVVQTSGTTATVDAIADATDFFTTALTFKQVVGIAYELPADGAITRVLLNQAGFFRNFPS